MRLPNVAAAVVPPEKITGYLLSTEHRDGQHKAAFFLVRFSRRRAGVDGRRAFEPRRGI
jgi:hypothetical protein